MVDARIIHGECVEALRALPADSVDAVATHPPYGLGDPPDMVEVLRAWLSGEPWKATGRGFMGREWDAFVPGPECWREVLRVLKPGGHAAIFAGTRTQDVMGLAVRLAGFEIRDSLQWIYGSGFPKNHDPAVALRAEARKWGRHGVVFERLADRFEDRFAGYGTAIKPAYEPIILARKPLAGTVGQNATEHGTGMLNVEGCRIEGAARVLQDARAKTTPSMFGAMGGSKLIGTTDQGRWPANILLGCACEHEHDPGCAVAVMDAQSGVGVSPSSYVRNADSGNVSAYAPGIGEASGATSQNFGDVGGASRFFYTAKASRSEREAGLDHRVRRNVNDGRDTSIDNAYQRGDTKRGNIHPTVKPLDLMRWIARLVNSPGGRVLDPFAGSGTTGMACVWEGFDFTGIELDHEHCEIARARIAQAKEDAGKLTAEEAEAKAAETGEAVQVGLWGDE